MQYLFNSHVLQMLPDKVKLVSRQFFNRNTCNNKINSVKCSEWNEVLSSLRKTVSLDVKKDVKRICYHTKTLAPVLYLVYVWFYILLLTKSNRVCIIFSFAVLDVIWDFDFLHILQFTISIA
jgi:hypothetical protein